VRTSGHHLAGDGGSGDPPATSRPQPQDPKLKSRWILNVLLDLSADLLIRLSQEHARRRLATGEGGALEGEDAALEGYESIIDERAVGSSPETAS
jgi:hypothetical protein